MSYVTLMQDWTTIQTSGASTVVQNESEWLDMADFLDLVFYISTQQVSGTTPTLTFRTSPSKDEALFTALNPGGQVLTATTNHTPIINRFATATTPLARYVRWELSGTTVIATFRIYVAATTQGALLGR